jgi:hypothetical protein
MTDPQVIVNLGTGGADLNGQNGSTASADSNDALFLDWPGANGGSYIYNADAIGNRWGDGNLTDTDITGDLEIVAHVSFDAVGINGFIVSQGSGNTTAFNWRITRGNTNTLALSIFDGTAVRSATSTAGFTYGADEAFWFKITKDAATREVLFYTSDDGNTFTQLGASVTMPTSATGTSTTGLFLGARLSSQASEPMKWFRFIVRNGIGGTSVLDLDTSILTSGSATTIDTLTSQTLTLNRATSGRKNVAVVSPVWLFGTDDFMTVPNNALLDIGANDDFTVVAVARVWGTASFTPLVSKGTGSSGFVGYIWRTSNSTPNNMQAIIGEGSGFGTGFSSPSFTFGDGFVATLVADRQAATLARYSDNSVTSGSASFGDLSTASLFTIGRHSPPASTYANAEIFAVAFFRRKLSAAEVSQIVDYYAGKAA